MKNMFVKLDHFPKDGGEHQKYLKPPPSSFFSGVYVYVWQPSSSSPKIPRIPWLRKKPMPWGCGIYQAAKTWREGWLGVLGRDDEVLDPKVADKPIKYTK